MRSVFLAIAAGAIFALFLYATVGAIGYAAALSIPQWWWSAFHSRSLGLEAFVVLGRLVAVVAVSAPFAWLVARLFGPRAALVATAMTVAAAFLVEYPSAASLIGNASAKRIATFGFEVLILVASMPLLVGLLRSRPLTRRSSAP